jgi:replicative DNA helicase
LDIQELKEKINILDFIESRNAGTKIKKLNNSTYRLEVNPNTGTKDNFTIYQDKNSFYDFALKQGGDVYEYLKLYEGMEHNEIMETLKNYIGVTDEPIMSNKTNKKTQKNDLEALENDKAIELNTYKSNLNLQEKTALIDTLYDNMSEEEIKIRDEYFASRGLSPSFADVYKISYNKKENCIYLPSYKGSNVAFYTRRMLDKNAFAKYLGEPQGNNTFFNFDIIEAVKRSNKPLEVYVTEGVFDALSLMEIGKQAISIGGTSNINKFIDAIEGADPTNFITLFDNDKPKNGQLGAGQKATETAQKHRLLSGDIPERYNDINEWIVDDRASFEAYFNDILPKQLEAKRIKAKRPYNNLSYINEAFKKDLKEFKESSIYKTGFKELDERLKGVKPQTYFIGGVPSVGKTTFIYQIADNLAKQGAEVLYFNLEQPTLHLVTKSISRITAQNDFEHVKKRYTVDGIKAQHNTLAVSKSHILDGYTPKQVNKAIEEYKTYAKNISIYDNSRYWTLDNIEAEIESYINATGTKPVVFIDYLQLVRTSELEQRMTDKQRIDERVNQLKDISTKHGIAIFIISSLNRDNYYNSIEIDSFKESGNIEFGADVILGLQYQITSELESTNTNKGKNKNSELLKEARQQLPRLIRLRCLKNRNGENNFEIDYNYYANFDLFTETGKAKQKKTPKTVATFKK